MIHSNTEEEQQSTINICNNTFVEIIKLEVKPNSDCYELMQGLYNKILRLDWSKMLSGNVFISC